MLIKSVRKFFYVFKCLKNILTVNVKTLVYKSLVQSIVSYGIAYWGNAYQAHIKKLTTTLNCLVKFIFSKLRLSNNFII